MALHLPDCVVLFDQQETDRAKPIFQRYLRIRFRPGPRIGSPSDCSDDDSQGRLCKVSKFCTRPGPGTSPEQERLFVQGAPFIVACISATVMSPKRGAHLN